MISLRLRALLALLIGATAFPELVYWLGSLGLSRPTPGEPCVVLVLGADDPRLQRRRVEAGVAALREAGCARMILSGGMPRAHESEADRMAIFARALGIVEPILALERTSRNTWENIGNSLPMTEGYTRVFLVSDSLHPYRARKYWRKRAPERAAQGLPAGYYRFADLYGHKWYALVYETGAWLRDLIFYRS